MAVRRLRMEEFNGKRFVRVATLAARAGQELGHAAV
jgi:hypothetical protein